MVEAEELALRVAGSSGRGVFDAEELASCPSAPSFDSHFARDYRAEPTVHVFGLRRGLSLVFRRRDGRFGVCALTCGHRVGVRKGLCAWWLR